MTLTQEFIKADIEFLKKREEKVYVRIKKERFTLMKIQRKIRELEGLL